MLTPGPELDKLVAEACGLEIETIGSVEYANVGGLLSPIGGQTDERGPSFCPSIAMENRSGDASLFFDYDDSNPRWGVAFIHANLSAGNPEEYQIRGDTPAMALCLAILSADGMKPAPPSSP